MHSLAKLAPLLAVAMLLPVRTHGADLTILNQTEFAVDVYVWCTAHQEYSDLNAARWKGVRLFANRHFSFSPHAGTFRLIAVDASGADRTQRSQLVALTDDAPKRYSIMPPQAVPDPAQMGRSREFDLIEISERGIPVAPGPDYRVLNAPERYNGVFRAANLGIVYAPVAYSDGTFGARLTMAPDVGSPAAQLGLEPGDTIYVLDGQRIYTDQDVLAHRAWTDIWFINIRTNRPQFARVYVP
jgi:hypothetical protein